VEDHADTRRCICNYFKQLGHHVRFAGSVTEALDQISAAPCDVFVSDVGLPDGDGCELLLRAGFSSDVYTVAVSGFGMGSDRTRSKAAGFHRHILKPFGHEQLDAVLEEAIAFRKAQSPG
jgi:CheY-like chemotaxis protein